MEKNIGAYIVFTPCCNDGEVLEFGDEGDSTWWIGAVEGDVYEYTPIGGDPTLNGCYIVSTVSNPSIPPTQVPTNAEMRYLGHDCKEAAQLESLCECEEVTILVPCCQGDKSLYFQATKRIFNPTEAYTYKDKSYTVVKSKEPTPQIGFPPPFPGDDEVIGENVPCDDTECCVCIRVRSKNLIVAPISVVVVNCDGVNEGLTILTNRAWSEKICARSWDLNADSFEVEVFGDCIDDVCPITTCFLLEDCEGIEEDIYVSYNSIESYIGEAGVLKIDGFPDTCWSFREISECDCVVEITVLSSWTDCEECRKCKGYKLTNCEDSNYIKYTTNDLFDHIGQAVEFEDCAGCWFVECLEIAPPSDQNLIVEYSFDNCKTCLSTFWKLTPCPGQEHDPIFTDTNLLAYSGFIVTLDNIPGICFELEEVRDLEGNNFETVFINEYYIDCNTCKAEIFDCQCSTAVNGGSLSESLQYLDCNGNWIETAIIPSGTRSPKVCAIEWDLKNAIDIEWYGDCTEEEIENEDSIWECPEAISRIRSIRPGYNTPGCPADYYDKVSCRFAEAYYKIALEDRYGISTNCKTIDLNKWEIKKEMLNLTAITNPDYVCPPTNACFDPCATSTGFINCTTGECLGYTTTYEANAPNDTTTYTDCETGEITTIEHVETDSIVVYTVCATPGTPIITEGFLELQGECVDPPPCVESNYRLTYEELCDPTLWEITIPGCAGSSPCGSYTWNPCTGPGIFVSVPGGGESVSPDTVVEVCSPTEPFVVNGTVINLGHSCGDDTQRSFTTTDCEGITINQEVQAIGGVFEVCSVEPPVISGLAPASIEEIGECALPCVDSYWELTVPTTVPFTVMSWVNCAGVIGQQIVLNGAGSPFFVCASEEPTGANAVNLGECPPPCVLIEYEISFEAGTFQSYSWTTCNGTTASAIIPCNFPCPAIVVNVCSLEGSPPTAANGTVTEIGPCP